MELIQRFLWPCFEWTPTFFFFNLFNFFQINKEILENKPINKYIMRSEISKYEFELNDMQIKSIDKLTSEINPETNQKKE